MDVRMHSRAAGRGDRITCLGCSGGGVLIVMLLLTATGADEEAPQSAPAAGTYEDLYGDELPPGAVLRLGTTRYRNRGRAHCVAFSPDGRFLASGGQEVRVFDASSGRLLSEIAKRDLAHRTWTLAVSPDGRYIATGDQLGQIRIHSIADGKEVFAAGHPGRGIVRIAFLPDERTLVSFGGDGDVRLWDVAAGKVTRVFKHGFSRRSHEMHLAVSRDGRLVAGSCDSGIRIWDVAAGTPQTYIAKAHDAFVTSLAFAPDGESLVSYGVRGVAIGADDPDTRQTIYLSQIRTWDVESGQMQRELLTDEPGYLAGLAVPISGEFVVAVNEQNVLFFDPVTGEPLRSLDLPDIGRIGHYNSLSISPDGTTLAVAAGESAVHLVDLETGQLSVSLLEAHTDLVRAVDWSEDGDYIVTGSSDGTVRIWDAATSQPLRGLEFSERCMNLFAIAISPDCELVAAAGDYSAATRTGQMGLVKLWHVHSGRLLHEFRDERGAYFNLAFSSDGKLLAAAALAEFFGLERGLKNRGGAIDVFRTDSGKKVLSLTGHDRTATALHFTSGGKELISVGLEGAIRTWKLPSGELETILEIESVDTAAISPEGTAVVTGAGIVKGAFTWPSYKLTIQNVPSGEVMHEMRGDSGFGAHALDISSDGELLVSGCQSDVITIWDMQTGEKLLEIPSPHANVFALAFDPSGRRVVTGMDDGTAVVWDVSEARAIAAGDE